MDEPVSLLLLGASVRAAACSALRAGLQPWGADLFGDADLQRWGRFERIANLSGGALAAATTGPAGPWLYTGALENRPELVGRISRTRPVWGNRPEVLRRVRSPRLVQQVLNAADVPCPAIRDQAQDLQGRAWLMKPRAGASGRGIERWTGKSTGSGRNHYLQEFIEGEPCAAIYLGTGTDRNVHPALSRAALRSRIRQNAGLRCESATLLLGVTRQLVGLKWLHARSFHYCGSIGPLQLEPAVLQRFQRLGDRLTTGFGLRGIYGVDCILRDGVPWPVEINPRYTASVEVLELALQMSALALHRASFDSSATARIAVAKGSPEFLGKAVLFASADLSFPAAGPWLPFMEALDLWAIPAFADIPHAGQEVAAGRPVLTFFAKGSTMHDCEERLRHVAADLDRRLAGF